MERESDETFSFALTNCNHWHKFYWQLLVGVACVLLDDGISGKRAHLHLNWFPQNWLHIPADECLSFVWNMKDINSRIPWKTQKVTCNCISWSSRCMQSWKRTTLERVQRSTIWMRLLSLKSCYCEICSEFPFQHFELGTVPVFLAFVSRCRCRGKLLGPFFCCGILERC